MKIKWPKIDWSVITEIAGVSLATYGIYLVDKAAAFIGLGVFLVWLTEKE
jgi:hypothetical protein